MQLIDGKALAASLLAEVREATSALAATSGITPGLAVILVGNDPASEIYVRRKLVQVAAAGMASFEHRLPADTTQSELLTLIDRLNHDPTVHGILVQLPLPPHIHATPVLDRIDPAKDVDGFHPVNVGRLSTGGDALVPCTPLGCIRLLDTVIADYKGLKAVAARRAAG